MSRLPACLAAALLLLPGLANAHVRSESHSAWILSGGAVNLIFTVPELEAKRLGPTGALPSDREIGAYLKDHVSVTAEGKPCPMTDGPDPESAASGFRKIDYVFTCPTDKEIVLNDTAFFERVPTHVNLAQIQTSDGEFIEQMFTDDHQTLEVSGADSENRLKNAAFIDYVLMGVMHIFTGFDHQSFLLGLVLISRRFRDLAFVITGFTLGHSVTLALAVTGILRPHADYIDALVALTIALIGAENASVATGRPGTVALGMVGLLGGMVLLKLLGIGTLPLALIVGAGLFGSNYLMVSGHVRDAGRLRLVVTLVFGLIHGFGFASNLLEMKLPTERLAELLVGFNLGVEVGQLSLVTAVVGLVYLLRRSRFVLPRPLTIDVGSALLVGLGLFWFIQRSFA